ncbi:MAG TPA: VOC family protein [Pyrinomonadaceae bacterium]|nr:VOC family protein [Pyrinomonadaceae bacterium]
MNEQPQVDMQLEVALLAVSDVDRAKAFYEKLGWRVDIDFAHGDFRGVQVTPHNSNASVIFGKGITSAKPGAAPSLILAVHDVDAARAALIARGLDVSEVFHFAAGPFNNAVENPRAAGRDPQGRSYSSFASFEDPDGNSWLLQEITTRLPGRIDSGVTSYGSVSDLESALRRAEAAHGEHEKLTGERDANWPDWYSRYMAAEQSGQELPK